VQADLQVGRLITIPIEELNVARTIEITYRRKEPLPPAPAALLELLRQWPWDRASQCVAGLWDGFGELTQPEGDPVVNSV
jgi:hypothetical protein